LQNGLATLVPMKDPKRHEQALLELLALTAEVAFR
jgi:hypothetical protein